MTQNPSVGANAILIALFGAATLGAFAAAFISMKMGKQLQNRLVALPARFNTRAGQSDLLDAETVRAMFI